MFSNIARYVLLFLCIAVIAGKRAESKTHHDPVYGDALVVGTIGEPSVLIPMLATDSASHDVAGLIFSGLIKYDTDLSIIGDLASSWDISPDGLTITFHLRKDAFWEDGTPCTAHDVLYGFKTITDPSTPTAYAEEFKQVLRAEAVDDYTFRVTYRERYAPALTSWGNMAVLPRHVFEGTLLQTSPLVRKPMGNGPFRFKEWIPGDRLVLGASPSYFLGRPYLDAYICRFIPDPATLFLELRSGTIDFMALTPLQYARQTATDFFQKNFNKYTYPSFSYTYLAFNFLHPWFQDKRVRQAIAHAIDKKEIVEGVLLGLGEIATGPYVPHTWPYNPDVPQYTFDQQRAAALLDAAGWHQIDTDGVRIKDGARFEFTILTNMGNSLRMNTATIIQWRLAQIGIKVKIRVIEWSTLINEFIDKKRFEALLLGWSIGVDPDQYDIWHSSKVRNKELNFISYNNPEVDRLLEAGRRTFDIDERKRIYGTFQSILAEDVPYIFLYVPYALPIVHRRFHNIHPSPIGITYNLYRWYVPRDMQRYRLSP
ncbi:MAG: peptide-binding protein [Desulfobacterota bacterium]|nr:peptide-binding protein [Thermodesulfobacteriota bacterium]